MDLNLDNKSILITGGLGAIAESMLKTLDANGAKVIVTDARPQFEGESALNSWGLGHLPYYPMDLCKPETVANVMENIFKAHPHINVALGHAGGTKIQSFLEQSPENFQQVVDFNLMGQTYFSRAVLKHWVQQQTAGHLIFTSSYVSRIPMVGIAAYTMCKAALEMFAKNLALEVASYGIRVNLVSPGNVEAGSSKALYDTNPEYRAWVDRISPLGQRNSPQAIANAFLFLCSDLALELDGHVLQVDRGVALPKLG